MDGQRDSFTYDEAVDEIARRYGVPRAVYTRMLRQESGDNDAAVSPKGAFTAWQIMPDTARRLGYDPEELKREPLKAAEGGLRLLRDGYKKARRFAENEKHAWMIAVSMYHAGETPVMRDLRRGGKGLPLTSDGLITTRDHVLKIFDGLEGSTLDRSPLSFGDQTKPSPARKGVSVKPDALPNVSLFDLPAQTAAPVEPKSGAKNASVPVENFQELPASETPENPPVRLPFITDASGGKFFDSSGASSGAFERSPLVEQSKREAGFFSRPSVEIPPESEADYQEFLKYAELSDNDESRRQYIETVLKPLAETEAEQTAAFERETEQYNRASGQRNAELPRPAEKAPAAAVEIPKDETKTAQIKTDDDIKRTLAGSVEVDLSRKPAGVPLQEFLFREAINTIGEKYGLTPEQKRAAENAIRQGAGKLLVNDYSDVTDENFKKWLADYRKTYGKSTMTINLTRNAVNAALTGEYDAPLVDAVRRDFEREQSERNMKLYSSDVSLGKDEFGSDIKPRDYTAEYDRQYAEKRRLENPDYALYRAAENQLLEQSKKDPFADGKAPTREEIIERAKLLKQVEADAKELEKIPVLGTLAARAMGGVGRVWHSIAGVTRIATAPFESLIGNEPYKLFKNIGDKAVLLGQMTNPEGSFLYEAAGLPFDAARLVVLSRLPGGAVVGFAVDSGLQSAGRGENLAQIAKETVKGGSLGALFKLSGGVAGKVATPALKPIARIGTITGGTYAVEKAFGATDKEAAYSALLGGLFEIGQTYGASLKNRFVKVWKDGKAETVKVEENGDVVLYEAKENAPVDIELVLDPADGVYKRRSDFKDSSSATKPAGSAASAENRPPERPEAASSKTPAVETPRQESLPFETPSPVKSGEAVNAQTEAVQGESQKLLPAASELSASFPKNTTTRRLDPLRLTKLDSQRAAKIDAEYESVSGKTPAELLAGAKIVFKNGELYTNAEATELLRQADLIAFSDAERFNYYGRYLNPQNAARVEKALKLHLGSARFSNPEYEAKKQAFIAEFEKARRGSKLGDIRQIVTAKNAPYGLKAARQEESGHAADYAVGDRHTIAGEIFKSDPLGRRAMRRVRRSGYEKFSDEALGREVAAKIFTDTASVDLKMSQSDINYLRELYVRNIFAKGKTFTDFEGEFNRVSKSARNFIKDIKSNYEQLGSQQSGQSGTGTTRPDSSGNQRIDGATEPVGKTNALGNRAESGTGTAATGRQSKLNQLALYEKKFIERKAKGDPDLADRAAGEVLYSRPAKSNKMTIGDYVIDISSGMPKALKATADLSAAGRQGLILSIPHPIIASKAFLKQIGSALSERYHKLFVEQLENHPFTEMAQKSGLYLSNLADGSINSREEQFMSRILGDDRFFSSDKAEKARRALTVPIRASERAYGAYLDDLRINAFTELAKQVAEYNKRNGITDNATIQRQIEGVARFVNYATGRGSLGKFEDAAEFFNVGFFSARNWASRFQVMNPKFYATLPPGARGAVVRDFGKYLGAMVLTFGLLKAAGFDISLDPDNPDFLKVRIGQYSYDISGAMVQQIRYLAQMVKAASEGDAQKMSERTIRYAQTKLAPLPSAVVAVSEGKKISGEPTTVTDEALGLIKPITIEQLVEGLSKDGLKGLVQSSPDILGIATMRYANSLEIGRELAEVERQLAKAKPGSAEEKRLEKQVKLWRAFYYRSKRQPGELPFDYALTPEQREERAGNGETGRRPRKIDLADQINFYKQNRDKLFSFAKDELESLIIQNAEYLRLRGKLSALDLRRIKEIIPDYEPLRENQPGVNLRPEKLPKRPKRSRDLPKRPRLPAIP